MTVFTFYCSRTGSFSGGAGTTVKVNDHGANWEGGADIFAVTQGNLGFGSRSMKLLRGLETPVATILLPAGHTDFSAILMGLTGPLHVHLPRAGVDPTRWEWRLFNRWP